MRRVRAALVRTGHQPPTSFRSAAKWRADVDMLADAPTRGETVPVSTETWASGTNAQKQSLHRYALASFLLEDGGTNHSVSLKSQGDPSWAYHSTWNTDLGAPDGAHGKKNGLYVRDFVHGKVVVNPTNERRTISLGGSYRSWNGTLRTSVTLQPHTADILSDA